MRKLIIGAAIVPGLLGLIAPAQGATVAYCNYEKATIVGTSGADVLRGTSNPDWIAGLGGNDVISGLGEEDVMCGGLGADTIYAHDKAGFATCQGTGGEEILGGKGNDKLYGGGVYTKFKGGPGNDLLDGCKLPGRADYTGSAYGVDVRLWKGIAKGEGFDTLRHISDVLGSGYRDILIGSDYEWEWLYGNGGNDYLKGGAGGDYLTGSQGDDEIVSVDGIFGNDRIEGGEGTDACTYDDDSQTPDRYEECE
jgi:Ca2+-binding RTX toxin-like protein